MCCKNFYTFERCLKEENILKLYTKSELQITKFFNLKATRFIDLLQNPQKIGRDQNDELKALVAKYPYFQAARALHLKGLKQKASVKYNQALKVTAAYTSDRSILFDYITSETFNQNVISLAIKHNSEHIKSITVYQHDDISVNKSVSIDDALKEHIKNTQGVLDPNLFENKNKITHTTKIELDGSVRVDSQNTESASEKTLKLGQPLSFEKNETHSFAEWLKITSFKPIDRAVSNQREVESKLDSNKNQPFSETGINRKFELIDRFLEKNPKINPSKERSTNDPINLAQPSNDVLMTETLARIYLEQKNYEKAIQSYRILSLKYPEKSGFFADQIKAVELLQENNK